MTLRAWIIEMRGRVRERLCPDLQVLRYENALMRRALARQYAEINRLSGDVARLNGADAYRQGYDDALNDALRNGMQWAVQQFSQPTQAKDATNG